MAKTKKTARPKKPAKTARKPATQEDGDHARMMAPKSAVKSFIDHVISTKNATSEAGQELSTATKRASDAGVNVPAARIAARIFSKAKQDPIKARVMWEDLGYYLEECTSFSTLAPPGMFSAEESGQRRRKPKEPAQRELPADEPEEEQHVSQTMPGDVGWTVTH